MKKTFSQSMAWLHTWSGLIFGWILFAIFLTGSISVFDREISHWMQPEIGKEPVSLAEAVDRAAAYLHANVPDSENWLIVPPSQRGAVMKVYWQEGLEYPHVNLDPATGNVATRDSEGGNFFVHFHFQLYAGDLGTWIVGAAGLMMLVGLLTGIVIHKRIFKDFFTFRPGAGAQRSWLDAHNALGVLTLPFLLMITFSGLAIFAYMYIPSPIQQLYGTGPEHAEAYFDELMPHVHLEPTGRPAPLQPLGALAERAQATFGGLPLWYISVDHPGDENAVVSIGALNENQLNLSTQLLQFNGVSGEVLQEGMVLQPAALTQRVLTGLHFAQFGGYFVHWLYFISGLVGTAMIGAGLTLFIVKRRHRYAGDNDVSPRFLTVAEKANVAAIAGPLLATLAYFWSNRLLPPDWPDRAAWEINAFFGLWLLSLVHVLARPAQRAWIEQFGTVACLGLTLPLLNLLTSDRHLLVTLSNGEWRLAAVDLTVMVLGLAGLWLVRHLRERSHRFVSDRRPAGRWKLADS